MSYSFQVRAATKAQAIAAVAAKLAETEAAQPAHSIDRAHAEAAATAFINLLPDDEEQDVAVTVSGWVSGQWQGNEITSLTGANITVTAGLAARTAGG